MSPRGCTHLVPQVGCLPFPCAQGFLGGLGGTQQVSRVMGLGLSRQDGPGEAGSEPTQSPPHLHRAGPGQRRAGPATHACTHARGAAPASSSPSGFLAAPPRVRIHASVGSECRSAFLRGSGPLLP